MAFVSTDRAFAKISELEHHLQVLNNISDEDFSDDLKKLMDIRYHLSKFDKKTHVAGFFDLKDLKKESKS